MKRLIFFSIFILPLWAATSHAQRSEPIVLEVRSAGFGMPVTFEAAWLTKRDGHELKFTREITPFKITVYADSLTAILSKRSGLFDLKVEMFHLEKGEKRQLCSGEGRVIMMFSNLQTHSVTVTSLP
jgi:hypothetical protein